MLNERLIQVEILSSIPLPTFEKPYGKVQRILKKGWASLATCHYRLRQCRVKREDVVNQYVDQGSKSSVNVKDEFSDVVLLAFKQDVLP